MADVVQLSAPDFTQAAATVAQHLETAAIPARSAAQPPMVASPVDVAAAGAADAIQTKVDTLSTQLLPQGPAIRQAGAAAAAALIAQDATNAARMPSVPSVPSPPSPRITALDHTFKRGPGQPPPPTPDPVGKLGLPDYKPGSLSGDEARAVYAHGELRMRELNEQLIKQGLSPEQRAKIMFEQRNSLRSWTRDLMQDRAGADWLRENRPNQTWDQSVQKQISRGNQGDAIYDGIIDSSTRSNAEVNAATGVNPEEPPPLPPERPSAPIEAAPPESPPLVERGGEGPMIAGGPGTPLGPQLAPPPHGHPHWLGETSIEEWEEGQH